MVKNGKEIIFISYSHKDTPKAKWIEWFVRKKCDRETIFDKYDFAHGQSFRKHMGDAVEKADRMIALLSPDYQQSEQCMDEWNAFNDKQNETGKSIIMPFRVADYKPKGLLRTIIYSDLVGTINRTELALKVESTVKGIKKPDDEPVCPFSTAIPETDEPSDPFAVPKIWHVPYNRNLSFTGRDEILHHLHEGLTSGTPAAVTQVLHSGAGIGKTQIALEYAYHYAHEYKIVWWINSEFPASIPVQFIDLAQNLSKEYFPNIKFMIDFNLPHYEIMKSVLDWLRQHKSWLIIYDNAPDQQSIKEFIPQGLRGNVIITSLSPDWSHIGHEILVTPWKREESVRFIVQRTGSDDLKAADKIADELKDLPLALEQSVAYAKLSGISLGKLYDILIVNRTKILEQVRQVDDYHSTVATTWLSSIKSLDDGSTSLLFLLAFFAPEDIPLAIIKKGKEYLPSFLEEQAQDDILLNTLIKNLRALSLVDRFQLENSDNLSIHRLLQDVVLGQLDKETFLTYAWASAKILDNFIADTTLNHKSKIRILPHVLSISKHLSHIKLAEAINVRLLNFAGLLLDQSFKLNSALDCFENALNISQHFRGCDQVEYATSADNLAGVLRKLERFNEALVLSQKALEIYRQQKGEEDHEYIICLKNIGLCYLESDELHLAKKTFARSYHLSRKHLGASHEITIGSLSDLAVVIRQQGNPAGAIKLHKKSLRLLVQAGFLNMQNISFKLSNLSVAYKHAGMLRAAKILLTKAIKADSEQQENTINRSQLILHFNNLGCVYRAEGDYDKALDQFLKANDLVKKFGKQNIQYASTLESNLETINLMNKINCKINEFISKGEKDNDVMSVLYSDLAKLHLIQEDFHIASHLYRHALEVEVHNYGPEHEYVGIRFDNLAASLMKVGEFEESLNYNDQALRILASPDIKEKAHLGICLSHRGSLYEVQGKLLKAKSNLQKAYKTLKKALGEKSEDTLLVHRKLDRVSKALAK